MQKKQVDTIRQIADKGTEAQRTDNTSGKKHKKPFIEPELRTYPPLRNVTFLTVAGASGGSVY